MSPSPADFAQDFDYAYAMDTTSTTTARINKFDGTNFHTWKFILRVAGFWYCVPVTGQPKPVQSEPTLITPPRITPLLIMPPVGTRL
ncbi:unnamed protein product [Phytophthora lilii]|uniref:Unnamed protein product n=1 Tax=Phytophthora lilii TaxID=2077276 RepID=A0A9W7D626_9STRA|nr:unnamed protein product [Phytophthora lilii]